MNTDKLISLCARALNVNSETLTDASGPGSVKSWDSLGTMTILAAIDEELGVRLPLSAAARITSIAELRAAVHARGRNDI